MIKLYDLIYEQLDKSPNRFTNEKYALVVADEELDHYALIDIAEYQKQVELWEKYEDGDTKTWLAAYGNFNPKDIGGTIGNCAGASTIGSIVASPLYPSAGYAMYALYSKYTANPITSDRNTSTSDPAKKLWQKIENSPEWEKIDLNNFRHEYDPDHYPKKIKIYYDIQGSWPDRKIKPKPQKPEIKYDINDDCRLPPTANGTEEEINKKLGTADAYFYRGPLDPDDMISVGNNLMQEMESKFDVKIKKQRSKIKGYGVKMFDQLYRG